jgi:hypothetical protein
MAGQAGLLLGCQQTHPTSTPKMAHQNNPELLNIVLQLFEEDTGGFAEGIRLLVNEAMRQERNQALQAQPTNAPTTAWAMPMASKMSTKRQSLFEPMLAAKTAWIQRHKN